MIKPLEGNVRAMRGRHTFRERVQPRNRGNSVPGLLRTDLVRRSVQIVPSPPYASEMAHYVFNLAIGGRERAAALLRAKLWGIGGDERHRDELVPGDLALIYVATPERAFIGRAELTTAVHDWTPSEADAYPGDSPSGVVLSHVEEWDPAVPMDAAVQRIDPTASNPQVQANAAAGFHMDVVRITDDEYEAVLALSRDARGT